VEVRRFEIVLPRAVYALLGTVACGFLLYWLRGILTPIFLAFAIAYLLDPVVDRFEAWKVPRPLGIAIVMLVTLLLIVASVLLVVPTIVADIATVAKEMPGHAARWFANLQAWLGRYGINLPRSTTEWLEQLRTHSDQLAGTVVAPAGTAVKWVLGGTASAIGAAVGALIVPVLAIYLLYDFDNITAGIRDLVPHRFRPTVVSYARDIDFVLGHFVRGQLVVMAILACLYGGAYTALGIRLAIPIGIAAGILNFIPYLGSAFALVAGLLMCLLGGGGWPKLVGVILAYAVVQTLEGFVITPRVVGKTVGLRDVWVLLALFIGGELFGFMGVLLALPAAAVAKIFVERAVEHYRSTELFLANPPPSGEVVLHISPEGQAQDPEEDSLPSQGDRD
jgi:predicted PurR-regulated permease PerM